MEHIVAGNIEAWPQPTRAAMVRASLRVAAHPLSFAILFAALLLGTAIGPAAIGPDEVVRVLLRHVLHLDVATEATADTIVWQIRFPRVLLAGLVGGTLGYAGAAYQGVFRNPLADPYLMGVASGAGLAATVVIVGPLPLMWGNVSVVTLAAFVGAVGAVALSYALVARVGGVTPVSTLILSGVAISTIAVSATSYLMLTNGKDAIAVLSWLMGGFNDSSWVKMWFILPYTIPAAVVIYLHGRVLNVMQLDEQQAQQLGIDISRTQVILLVAASLASAAAVSVAGIIGFVGLVIPHAVRLVVGPDYRRLLPLSAVLGAAVLILADLGARTLVNPGELPIGVITAGLGAPFFLFLLRRQKKAYL